MHIIIYFCYLLISVYFYFRKLSHAQKTKSITVAIGYRVGKDAEKLENFESYWSSRYGISRKNSSACTNRANNKKASQTNDHGIFLEGINHK